MQCYVIFGIQGSGKGTQAELLSRDLDFQHVNTGDLFRYQVTHKTDLGNKVTEIISRGELVPDELVFQIVKSSLKEGCKGIVFDGFPRTMNQAKYLVEHFRVMQVFFLELAEEEAIRRISSRRVCSNCGQNFNLITSSPKRENTCDICGGDLMIRNDDKPEAITRRLKEFYEQTIVLKDYFAGLGLLTEINASTDIKTVASDIWKVIDNL